MEKSDFRNYRSLLLEVDQLRTQVQVLESSMYSPRGQRFSSTPRATSGNNRTMADPVARHIELVGFYEQELADKEAQQLAIERAIASLADIGERLVMRSRYIDGNGWPAVIREMQKAGYSERTVYRLHGYALAKLKEV